jgi:hypothetical protein
MTKIAFFIDLKSTRCPADQNPRQNLSPIPLPTLAPDALAALDSAVFRAIAPDCIIYKLFLEAGAMTAEAAKISPPPLGDISREEILSRLHDPSLTIVDVLPSSSYEAGHIPGAINLPVAEIEQRAAALLPDPAAEIAVYCAKFT